MRTGAEITLRARSHCAWLVSPAEASDTVISLLDLAEVDARRDHAEGHAARAHPSTL